MEPIVVALICTAVFGTVVILAAFLRQILLSRDKRLNEEAQIRAMAQRAEELDKIRKQMHSTPRFQAHYQLFGENKKAIENLDKKIEAILRKKEKLVERYAKLAMKESNEIISKGEASNERKVACDKVRQVIDSELTFYDSELRLLQKYRTDLFGTQVEFGRHLLAQEKARNANLDAIYKQHSALLEKLYLRHIEIDEGVAIETIKAGTATFKDLLLAPIQFLGQFFGGGIGMPNISLVQTRVERKSRTDVEQAEKDINNSEPDESNAYRKAATKSSQYDAEEDEVDETDSHSYTFAR
jgi:hypothetical protein